MERNMNSFDDNMTMPVTNRERTKGKRGVSFGGEALTASFDGGLSEAQQRRRKMVSVHAKTYSRLTAATTQVHPQDGNR